MLFEIKDKTNFINESLNTQEINKISKIDYQ